VTAQNRSHENSHFFPLCGHKIYKTIIFHDLKSFPEIQYNFEGLHSANKRDVLK